MRTVSKATCVLAIMLLTNTQTLAFKPTPDPFDELVCRNLSETAGLTDDQIYVNELVFEISESAEIDPTFMLCGILGNTTGIAFAFGRNGNKYLAYEEDVFRGMRFSSERSWGAIFILAHEIAHHALDHIITTEETPVGGVVGLRNARRSNEAIADEFSGFVLSKMGASLPEAIHALGLVPETESNTHPTRAARIEAARTGWRKASFGKSLIEDLSKLDPVTKLLVTLFGYLNTTLGFIATVGGAAGAIYAGITWFRKRRSQAIIETRNSGQ